MIPFNPLTIAKYSGTRDLNVWQNSQVVKYNAAVALWASKWHQRSDVGALTAVRDARTHSDSHVLCKWLGFNYIKNMYSLWIYLHLIYTKQNVKVL